MTAMLRPAPRNGYDVAAVRKDFPILSRQIHGKPLTYLDNAASAQKPRAVIDSMRRLLEEDYSNVHRGVHTLSQRSTDLYEAVRDKVAAFLNAPARENIVFTRNATEAFNLVAQSWGRTNLGPGDEIVLSEMEHHANIVPWQLLQAERGFAIKVAPIDDRGVLLLDRLVDLLGPRTRLVSITHASNVLGTVTPAAEIARMCRERGITVMFDGSQAAVHMPIDMQAIDPDFYVFTGHKLYGPTGVGVLYGRREVLAKMPPWQGGGDMIQSVSFAGTTFKDPPERFEAGTPPIIDTIGLGAAIDYVSDLGMDTIGAHERALLHHATMRLERVEGARIIGTAPGKAAIVSFTIDGVHPHDIGSLLDRAGIAVRVGRHCAEPLMDRFGVGATARASFGLYNTVEEADRLVDAVIAVREFFA
jgi:cysteine desulfurase / selenocysteine lyase